MLFPLLSTTTMLYPYTINFLNVWYVVLCPCGPSVCPLWVWACMCISTHVCMSCHMCMFLPGVGVYVCLHALLLWCLALLQPLGFQIAPLTCLVSSPLLSFLWSRASQTCILSPSLVLCSLPGLPLCLILGVTTTLLVCPGPWSLGQSQLQSCGLSTCRTGLLGCSVHSL